MMAMITMTATATAAMIFVSGTPEPSSASKLAWCALGSLEAGDSPSSLSLSNSGLACFVDMIVFPRKLWDLSPPLACLRYRLHILVYRQRALPAAGAGCG